jgi:hypothetical protein
VVDVKLRLHRVSFRRNTVPWTWLNLQKCSRGNCWGPVTIRLAFHLVITRACLLTVRISDWCPSMLLVNANGKELGTGLQGRDRERRHNTDDWQRRPSYEPETWHRLEVVPLSNWNVAVVSVDVCWCVSPGERQPDDRALCGRECLTSQFETYFSWTSLDDKSIIHSSQPLNSLPCLYRRFIFFIDADVQAAWLLLLKVTFRCDVSFIGN